MNDAKSIARVYEFLGPDLVRAITYPGGPQGLHRELVENEHRLDLMVDRARFAVEVLNGNADDHVNAWYAGRNAAPELCDHCKDLSARLTRAARDKAQAARDRTNAEYQALLAVVREGLGACVPPAERYEPIALRKALIRFFTPSAFREDPERHI